MTPLRPYALLALWLAHSSGGMFAAGDPLSIELSAQAGGQRQVARGQAVSATSTSAPRPVLTARAGTKLRIRWSVLNQEKAGSLADITMHVVLDRSATSGGSGDSRTGPDALYESAVLTDLTAGRTSAGDFVVDAPPPGSYRLRVATIGAARARGSEFAASMDVVVVP